jgi:colanic acid/amylovoran biosynthesis protein
MKRRGFAHRLPEADALRYRLACTLLRWGLGGMARAFLSPEEMTSLKAYLEADLVISSGGTYLVEHYELLPAILDYELTLSLHKPLVFFPQSLGPFEHTRYRDRLREIFSASERVMVRDQRSADHLRTLGVPESKTLILPDAGWALAPDQQSPKPKSQRPLRVGVSVRDWRHFQEGDPGEKQQEYFRMVAAGVTRLVQTHGARVTFISTCQGIPEYRTDDSKTAQEVVSLLDPDVAPLVKVDGAFRLPRTLIEDLSQFDAVIATRMHMAILALCAGVPVLPIAYEFKTRELFRGLGQESWVTDIENTHERSFLDLVDRFVRVLPELIPEVNSGVEKLRRRLSSLPEELKGVVEETGGR